MDPIEAIHPIGKRNAIEHSMFCSNPTFIFSLLHLHPLPLFFPSSDGLRRGLGEVGRPGDGDGGRAAVRVPVL